MTNVNNMIEGPTTRQSGPVWDMHNNALKIIIPSEEITDKCSERVCIFAVQI